MFKIKCPACKKSFLWTDDMPPQGKCPSMDCQWNYDVHAALGQNIAKRDSVEEKQILRCPFCSEEISSRRTVCRHCDQIVLGTKTFKKSYLFIAFCIILILLSLILKYVV